MDIFKFLRKSNQQPEQRSSPSSAPQEPSSAPGSLRTFREVNDLSTVEVTGVYDSQKIAAAYRCLEILSGTVASMPLRLYRRNSNGVFVIDTESSLSQVLEYNDQGRMSGYELSLNAVVNMCNTGNAYIMPFRKRGEVDRLVLLSPTSVNYDTYTDTYLVSDTINRIFGRFEAWEIIHIRNKSVDGGYRGLSTIQFAARALGIAQAADMETLRNLTESTARGFVTGGSNTTGFGALQEAQLKSVGDKITSELESGKRVISLPEGTDFKQMSISPKDLELISSRELSVYDVCRFYGVHPDMAFVTNGGNYKASEIAQANFLTQTLKPILRKFEAAFNKTLLLASQRNRYRIRFDITDLMSADPESMAKYYTSLYQIGALSTNEIRAKVNLDKIDGGDEHFVSTNLQPIKEPKVKGGINE